MSQQETTEQYGFGDLSAPWVTGVELVLWRASECLGQRALDRPQMGLGGADSDWVVADALPRNLWKISYRSGRIYFVAADKAYPGFLDNQGQSTLYVELFHRSRLRLGEFCLEVNIHAAARAYLESYSYPHLSTRWSIGTEAVTIGRGPAEKASPTQRICLDDPTVSRVHASVASEDGHFVLRALSQRSETRRNGLLMETGQVAQLQEGDMLHLGRQVLRFHHSDPAPAEGLRLFCLGQFRAWLADKELKNEVWQGMRVQHALVFLCLQRKAACSEGKLIDHLWMGEDVSRKRLHNVISHLRALLRPLHADPILRESGGIRLNPGLQIWLDLEELRRLLGEPANPSQAQRVSSLYSGPFLPGCSSPWAEVLRSQLESEVVGYLTRLAESLLSSNDYKTALALAQQAISLDPLAQPAYLVGIDCLGKLNRPGEIQRYCELARAQLEKARISPDPRLEAALRNC